MTFNGLKQIVYQSLLKQPFDNSDQEKMHINKILAGVLLFKTLQQLMSNSSKYQDDIKPTADEYAVTFKNVAESLGKKYISYKQISNKIKSYKILSFLYITDVQLNEIYSLYENKAELMEFSLSNFSVKMYNIGDISEKAHERLSKVHYKVLVPIIRYYKTYHNIKLSEVTVEDTGSTVGHQIKLAIASVPCNQIYSDISRDVMDVQKYISLANMTSDGYVQLLIK